MAKYPDCEALFYKQEFQSVIDCFDKKLGKNPREQSDISVRYNLALTLMRYKKYDESKKEFKKLISNPNTPRNILQGSKTALNRIEENSKISVNNSTGNNRTSTLNNEYFPCQTMYSKLDYSGALACYKEKNINYKSDRKEEINALYQYSEALHYAKKYNEARSGYMAIMSNPYADANLKKSSKEAIEEIDRRTLEDKYSECTSLFEKQDYEKTLSCYNRKQTNKDFKNHEVSWYNYAVTLQKLKRYQEAKKEFEAIISSHRARFYGLMAKTGYTNWKSV